MKCMKCGVSIPSGQVFCEDCLTDMAAHPVRQDAPLVLPRREKQVATKRSKKRVKKPEEQIIGLKRIIALLLTAVVVLSAALAISVYLLFQQMTEPVTPQVPDQNYTTSASAE